MYNELSSFRSYLNATIKPLTGGTYYFDMLEELTFPCVVVQFLNNDDSEIQTASEMTIQFDVIANNNDERGALLLLESLLNALKVNNNQSGGTCSVYDYGNPALPVLTTNKMKWIENQGVKPIVDNEMPEIKRYSFDISIIY